VIRQFLDWYLGALESGGYPLIAGLMALESSIVPLPSEVVIPPAAHLAVGRIRRVAARIPDGRRINARRFPELSFGAPEAAHAEHRLLETRGKRRRDRMTVDVMGRRNRHRLLAPGKSLVQLWHSEFHNFDHSLYCRSG